MPTREVLSVCYYSKCCEMFRAVEVIQTGGKWWESAVCSAVVESWYKRQYTCLVVKRRTAAVSPATSTIIAALWGCWWESAVSVHRAVVESWYEKQ